MDCLSNGLTCAKLFLKCDIPMYASLLLQVKVKSRTDFSYTTFQAIEVPGPGLFAKASKPLEACIKITPTVAVTNSLPYRMDGYLITLSSTNKEAEAAGARANTATPGRATLNGPSSKTRRSAFMEDATPAADQNQVIAEMRDLIQLLKHKVRAWNNCTG